MKKRLTISMLMIMLIFTSISAYALDHIVKGRVSAEDTSLPLPGVVVQLKGSQNRVTTNSNGEYSIRLQQKSGVLHFSFAGYHSKEISIEGKTLINIALKTAAAVLREEVVIAYGTQAKQEYSTARTSVSMIRPPYPNQNTETYNPIDDNRFRQASMTPLSTFSIDVDAASYSNIRRYINSGQLPPKDAVRIEEMINYFDYNYPKPAKNSPVSIHSEVASSPWNPNHKLVKIGLQGRAIEYENLPASNFVFLIDVSGSMASQNKLPLVISSIRMLTDQLRAKDKVSIAVYAGAAGIVLKPTSGDQKQQIKEALNQLQAGGSTAGGAGIQLAYKLARESFIKNGNNRVILATDGDFNVGASSDGEMQRLIEEQKKTGIFLTVLGYGMGNLKDAKMELLADKGNGNYAYIDNINEARKTLITEFGGTLFTVAKDVKLQIEFNPALVSGYRLVGYENRLLNKEDFNNDEKDAGDMGSGHSVTALYEIIPVGVQSKFIEGTDELKYQLQKLAKEKTAELMTVKLRYKDPDGDASKLMTHIVQSNVKTWEKASPDFRFAAAVAGFGMILRDSEFKQSSSFKNVIAWAENSLGDDKQGYRAEFLGMVRNSQLLAKDLLSIKDKMIMESAN